MFRGIGQSFLDLLYPPVCIHCQESIGSRQERLFCPQCSQELALIDPEGRCPYCFSEREIARFAACLECRRHPPKLEGIASACDNLGPARTLLNCIKSGDRPYLANGAGALMVAQFVRLQWPFPDLIVPIPISFWRAFEIGYNPNYLLAKSVGSILDRPVEHLLRIKEDAYLLKKSAPVLKDKTILFINTLMTSVNPMNDCAEILLCEGPRALYGMTFCRGQ
ncbi:MAG: double zinc ribbon domain-containing protein [Parachlamydia sp.]|nr:double zinc ribbon domain-containing protein [Parachlamydia sp.]